ncbi:MAG: hypothetical protein GY866_25830 [Proteobacteria bacterium]|nr:hypothetical protein [Pseudomonadota bacterium]
MPKGWYLSLTNSNVGLIKAKEEKPGYKIYFDRSNDFEEAAYYLRIAEAIFPKRSRILSPKNPSYKQAKKFGGWYFERLWWFEEYKNSRIPYSLTGDTVVYFIDQYKTFKNQLKKNRSANLWKASNKNRVEFYYTAKVFQSNQATSDASTDEEANPDTSIRVILTMKWYNYCGQPCGWGFEKSREIVFSDRNTVIKINGDGFSPKWISSSQNPYAPNQWITY